MPQLTIEREEKNWQEIQDLLGIKARGKIHIVYLHRRKYKKGETPTDEVYEEESNEECDDDEVEI